MEGKTIKIHKRSGEIEEYNRTKLYKSIYKGVISENEDNEVEKNEMHADEVANKITASIESKLQSKCMNNNECTYTFEQINTLVEEELMKENLFDAARNYIVHKEKNKPDIFKKRFNIKPYEYPQLIDYVDAIRHSYWIHTEFNYTSDIQDYQNLEGTPIKEIMKKTMLLIAQVENSVENFWSEIYRKMPKAEISSLGATFAESEVRHMHAYSHLIEILGLNEEFEAIDQNPIIKERVDYLDDLIGSAEGKDNKDYSQTIFTMSLFIENASLLSLLMIIMAPNRFDKKFKGLSNVAEATSKEEIIHFNGSVEIIKIIRKENPKWFNEEFEKKLKTVCREFYKKEERIIDWVFEEGDVSYLTSDIVKEFSKYRINTSLASLDYSPLFDVDQKLLESTDWFEEELIATKHGDNFDKRSVNYNKRSKTITADDLF